MKTSRWDKRISLFWMGLDGVVPDDHQDGRVWEGIGGEHYEFHVSRQSVRSHDDDHAKLM